MVHFERHHSTEEKTIIADRIASIFKLNDDCRVNFNTEEIKLDQINANQYLVYVPMFAAIDNDEAQKIVDAIPITKEEHDERFAPRQPDRAADGLCRCEHFHTPSAPSPEVAPG